MRDVAANSQTSLQRKGGGIYIPRDICEPKQLRKCINILIEAGFVDVAGKIQLLVSSYDEYVWPYGIEKPGIPTLKCLARAKVR